MRRLCIGLGCLFLFLAGALLSAVAQSAGSVSGAAYDGEHKAVAGVRITLRDSSTLLLSYAGTSGVSGEFRIPDVARGEYVVSAELSGYKVVAPRVVRVDSAGVRIVLDLVPASSASARGPDAVRTGAPTTQAPLQFQASGLRGLIDPGGYSASTDGAAADFLLATADVKRGDVNVEDASSKAWPCGLEPALRKAVAEHPEQAGPKRELGQVYLAHGQEAEAMPLLRAALKINVADAGAARELASALMKNGDFAQARMTLAPFAENAALPEVHQLLARAEEGSGLFREAEQEYRIAERDKPSEESVFGVGYESMLEGSTAKAEAVFKAGVEQYPRSMPMRVGVATAEFLAGDVSMAVLSLLDATDVSPDDLRPYALLAKISGVSPGEDERVLQSFERLLEREPDSAEANYLDAVVLSRKSDADSGHIEALLKRAIELDPSLAGAHLKLANLFAERGDYPAAVPEYEAAVGLDPSLPDARYRLALAYRRTGHLDQAGREMQLFLLLKARGNGKGQGDSGDTMGLSQFVSAVETPEQKVRTATPCVP